MEWVTKNTSPQDNFLIVSVEWWGADRVSEWFPVLSQRSSLLTVQGYEFSLTDTFSDRIRASKEVQQCALLGNLSCIENWARRENKNFSYLYIPKRGINSETFSYLSNDCCASLRKSVQESSDFHLVFENNDAIIYRNILMK